MVQPQLALEVAVLMAAGMGAGWMVTPGVARGLRRVSAQRSRLATHLIVGLVPIAGWVLVSASIDSLKHDWEWVGAMGAVKSGVLCGAIIRICVCWNRFEKMHERRHVRVGMTVRRADTGAGLARCRVTVATDAPSVWAVVGRGLAARIDQRRDGTFEESLGLTEGDGVLNRKTLVWFPKVDGDGDSGARWIRVRLDAEGFICRQVEQPIDLSERDEDPVIVDFGVIELMPVGDGGNGE